MSCKNSVPMPATPATRPRRPEASVSGMTVIEVLVALSVAALVALASASFYNQQRTLLGNFTPNNECKAILEGEMAYFRQQGMAATGLPWNDPVAQPVVDATRLATDFSDPWLSPATKKLTQLNNYRFSGAMLAAPLITPGPVGTNPVTIDNHPVQGGAMGLLNALYNNVSTLRTSDVDVSYLGNWKMFAPGFDSNPPGYDDNSLLGFRSTLRIEAYDLLTRAVITPAPVGAFWIRPQGSVDGDPTAYQFTGGMNARAGYRVTLKGEYQDRLAKKGATPLPPKTCVVSEDFNYPVDKEPQSISVILSTKNDNYRWTNTPFGANYISVPEAEAPYFGQPASDPNYMTRPECSQTPHMPLGMTLTIGFDTGSSTPIETGTVFMCRDMSQQYNPGYCPGAAGAEMDGNHYNVYTDPPAPPDPATLKWWPCSQVTACGIHPTSFKTISDPHKPGSMQYELRYDNPAGTDGLWGCNIRLDVASVDLAGNIRKLSDLPPDGTTKVSPIDARRYFQPVNCYRCYKKKKKNWGAFFVSSIMFGPGMSCIMGVGGVCKGSGSGTLKGYSCKNDKNMVGGSDYCTIAPAIRPPWSPTPTPYCMQQDFPVPPAYGGIPRTAPRSPSGTTIDDTVVRTDHADFCTLQAYCDGTTWKQLPADPSGFAPFVDCGTVYTQHKINITGLAAGTPAPFGSPMCTVNVSDTAPITGYTFSAVYGGMSICAPGITGLPQNVICSPPTPWATPTYPVDPQTGTPNNVDPTRYFYYEKIVPSPTMGTCTP